MTATLCAVFLAVASASPALEAAIVRFDGADFIGARDALTATLSSPSIDPEDRSRARLYLAASYFELRDVKQADAQLQLLFEATPDFEVNEALFPPEFIARARTQQAAQKSIQERKNLEVSTSVPVVQSSVPSSRAWTAVPIVAGVALVAAGTAGLVLARSSYEALTGKGTSLTNDQAQRIAADGRTAQILGAVGVGVGLGLSAVGVGALLWPAGSQQRVTHVSVGPGSVHVSGTF
jgi:hypothetical protein